MFKSKGKTQAEKFVKHMEELIKQSTSSDRIVDGFRGEETEATFVSKIIFDTKELIENNESAVGLENLLSNLYEIDFVLDDDAIELAKLAVESNGLKYNDWEYIEELKK